MDDRIRLGSKHLDGPHVIAEIGQNHNGDIYHAIRLIQMAAAAGADLAQTQLEPVTVPPLADVAW